MRDFLFSTLMFVMVVVFVGTLSRAETVAADPVARTPVLHAPDRPGVEPHARGVRTGRVPPLPKHRLPKPDDEFDHRPRNVSTLSDRVTLTLRGFDDPDGRSSDTDRYALTNGRVPAFHNTIAAKSRERRVQLALGLLDTDIASLDLTGEYFDRIAPNTQRMTRLSRADGSVYEDNEVGRFEMRADLFDNRLRYQARASRSKYIGAGGFWFDPGQTFTMNGDGTEPLYAAREGAEWWHRVDAALLSGRDVSFTAYAERGAGDPQFRTAEFEHFGADFGGRHTRFGAQIRLGRYRTHVWRRSHESDYATERELGARLDFGVGAVNASHKRHLAMPLDTGLDGLLSGSLFGAFGLAYFAEPKAPAWTERDETSAGAVELHIHRIFGIEAYGQMFSIGKFVPSTVTVRGTRKRTAFPDDWSEPTGPEDIEKDFGIDLSWETAAAGSSIGLARVLTDSRQPFRESADETEHRIDFSQDIYTDSWGLSAYLSTAFSRNRERDNRSKSKVYSGGADVTLYAANLPNVTFSIGANRSDFQFTDLGESFRSDSWNTGIELDFSNLLTDTGSEQNKRPSFIFGYRAQGTRDRDTYDSPKTKIDHGVFVLGNFRF